MPNTSEGNRLLASLAVFRELYDSERDVFGILSVFLNDIIKNQSLYSFTITEIKEKLNNTFEFNIPEAVVKTSLSRLDFLEKVQGIYTVKNIADIKDSAIDEKQQTIINNNDTIIERLFRFVEDEKKITLNHNQKESISHSFFCFLLDQNNGDEYIEFITSFILENESDRDFKSQLKLIREGVILYTGIKFNNNINDLGAWRTDLTIYLETEIIFHLAGLNGELQQQLAADFLTYVREINQKSDKPLIKLRYFKEVTQEIESFFTKAKYLFEGNERPNPNRTAMVTILNGCKAPSDILSKKSDLYTVLERSSIKEDSYNDYFNPENHQYNIVNQDIIDKVSKELDDEAESHLKFLNYIAIHRKEASHNNFENIGYILLTGNSTTLRVAWNDLVKQEGDVPLATHLSFLTSKFWFKLNKGFGKNVLPKSFDIITKSQIVLSSVLNNTVGEKFDELQSEFKKGNLTEQQAKARIIDLRNQVRKPEEIKNDIIKDVLSVITEDSLDKFIQEQSHFKFKAEQQIEENERLMSELAKKKEIEGQFLKSRKALLDEKLNLKSTLENQKRPLDKIVSRQYSQYKAALVLGVLFYYTVIISLVFYIGWDIMEPYTYVISLIPVLIAVIYFLVKERNFDNFNFLFIRKDTLQKKIYKRFEFNPTGLELVETEIESLKNEINSLELAVGKVEFPLQPRV